MRHAPTQSKILRHQILLLLTIAFHIVLPAVVLAAPRGSTPPPPRRRPGTTGVPAPRGEDQCAYQIRVADFRIEKLDRIPGVEPKGWNAPMRFHITLKNHGTGSYRPSFGDPLELGLAAYSTRESGGRVIRSQRIREIGPGQTLGIHWTFDYNTRDATLPTYDADFSVAVTGACNPHYPDGTRKTRRPIPVLDWARDAYKKANDNSPRGHF